MRVTNTILLFNLLTYLVSALQKYLFQKDQKKKSTMSFVSNSQVQSRNLSNLVKRLRPRTAALVAAPTFSFPLFLRLKLLGTMRESSTLF